MDKRQIFELLKRPITPTYDGGMVILDDKIAARHVLLRGTEFAVRDVAVSQSIVRWLVSANKLFLLVDKGTGELEFDILPFGLPLSSASYVAALIGDSSNNLVRIFVLNTSQGAWVLELENNDLHVITSSSIPFVACCSWLKEGQLNFGGMLTRRRMQNGEDAVEPGQPALLTVDLRTNNKQRDVRLESLEQFGALNRWSDVLPSELKQPHLIRQLIPESCIAASQNRFPQLLLFSISALPNWDEPEGLANAPLDLEMLGMIMLSPDDPTIIKLWMYKRALGTLRVETEQASYVYLSENRGQGGTVASIVRMNLESDTVGAEQQVQFVNIDNALICSKFQPRFHPDVGLFATAMLRACDEKSIAHYMQSDDGLTWHLVAKGNQFFV